MCCTRSCRSRGALPVNAPGAVRRSAETSGKPQFPGVVDARVVCARASPDPLSRGRANLGIAAARPRARPQPSQLFGARTVRLVSGLRHRCALMAANGESELGSDLKKLQFATVAPMFVRHSGRDLQQTGTRGQTACGERRGQGFFSFQSRHLLRLPKIGQRPPARSAWRCRSSARSIKAAFG